MDTFTFKVTLLEKPFTRRGVLSIVNSVYDLLGFAAPVMLKGRKILQQLVASHGPPDKQERHPTSLGRPPP